uniref:Uncharacterized protein n=1 Tax=Leersia perrieri TaxID=77586 RepID=A0A0D9UZH0_9ORYZ
MTACCSAVVVLRLILEVFWDDDHHGRALAAVELPHDRPDLSIATPASRSPSSPVYVTAGKSVLHIDPNPSTAPSSPAFPSLPSPPSFPPLAIHATHAVVLPKIKLLLLRHSKVSDIVILPSLSNVFVPWFT